MLALNRFPVAISRLLTALVLLTGLGHGASGCATDTQGIDQALA